MDKVLKVGGREVLYIKEPGRPAEITDKDDKGWMGLLDENLEMSLEFGDKSYIVTISRKEYHRMIEDGVLKPLSNSGN